MTQRHQLSVLIPSIIAFEKQTQQYHNLICMKIERNCIDDIESFILPYLRFKFTERKGFIPILRLVFSEIIDNIKEHARAEHVSIYLSTEDDTFSLIFTDDGRGFKGSLRMEFSREALRKVMHEASSSKGSERGFGFQHIRSAVLNNEINGEFILLSKESFWFANNNSYVLEDTNLENQSTLIYLKFSNLDSADFKKAYQITLTPNIFLKKKGFLH